MARPVELATEDGSVLRGHIYAGSNSASPGVVMAHGFSGTIEQIRHYAELFAKSGLSVLIYDHRCFGDSDGFPRQEVDPFKQIADWRDAITFALTQPEFLAEAQVGVWGSSFAGGLALVLAACDPRVRAVVAQIPNVSGARNSAKLFTQAQIQQIRMRAQRDRQTRLTGGLPDTLPVFSADPEELCALPMPTTKQWLRAAESLQDTTNWRNTVTLRSVEHLLEFEPAGWIRYVSPTPLLMIVGDTDECTFPDIQRAIFEQAGEPKKLVCHPGGHFETYAEYFAVTGAAARDWFTEHLQPASVASAG